VVDQKKLKKEILLKPKNIGMIIKGDYMDRITRPYQDELLKVLTDPDEAMEYLDASLEEDDPQLFLLALENVAKAKRISEQNIDQNHQKKFQEFQNIILISEFLNKMGLRLSVVSKC